MTGIEALALIKLGFTVRRKEWSDDKKCKSIDFLDQLYIHYVKPITSQEEMDENLETLFASERKIEFKELTFYEFLNTVDASEFLYNDWEVVNG